METKPQDWSYDPFKIDGFKDFINDTLAEFHTPGVSLAVIHGDDTFLQAYGYAELASKTPMTPRHLFYTASTTKSFVAALVSKLVYSAKEDTAYSDISWSTPLAQLIRDDFVLQDEYATNHITLLDALSHRSGMPRHDLCHLNDPEFTIPRVVRQLRYLPLHTELRTKWEYCNTMFAAVARAIETVTGQSSPDLMRTWLWEPLGIKEMFYRSEDALAYADGNDEVDVARGYMWNSAANDYVLVPFSDLNKYSGAGGLISNVVTYTKWVRMFLHPDNPSNPISAEAIADMSAAHMPIPDLQSKSGPIGPTAGLGLITRIYRGYEVIGHTGANNGYMTNMMWVPKLNWGVVIMHNSYSLVYEIVAWKMLDDFLQTPESERYDRAQEVRDQEAKSQKELDTARERLYPDLPESGEVMARALPLQAYEGSYQHPGYGTFELSIKPPSRNIIRQADGDPVLLYSNHTAFLDTSLEFHHVSGEHWWVYKRTGPGWSLVDEAIKAKFEVGANGKVSGMRLQAEVAMDELSWFEKVE